jgi:hypothetical protein
MRLLDDNGEQLLGTTAEFTDGGQGPQGRYSSSTDAQARGSASLTANACPHQGTEDAFLCADARAHRPRKPLGEVAQALLLRSLKSKAEGATCNSSGDDLLATEPMRADPSRENRDGSVSIGAKTA